MAENDPPPTTLSLADVRAHFAAVHDGFLRQLDALDAERQTLLASHPERERLEAAAAAHRRTIEESFTRIGELLVAAVTSQAAHAQGGEARLAELLSDIGRTTAGLEAMLQQMEQPDDGG